MKIEWVKRHDARWSSDLELRINGKVKVASIHRPIGSKGEEPKIVLHIHLPSISLKDGANTFPESELEDCKRLGISAFEKWISMIQ